MKVCKVCGVEKSDNCFRVYKQYKDKTCKDCRKAQQRLIASSPEEKKRRSEYQRNWRKENPEKARIRDIAAQKRRRSKINEGVINLSVEDWEATLRNFNNACAVCAATVNIQMDHFIPVATGNGDTSITNVIPLCAGHNINKRDKHPLNWLRYESGASVEAVERIITYLAKLNGMSPQDYEAYVVDKYYGIDFEFDSDLEYAQYNEDISLDDADNFIYDDDDWYLTMLNGRRG
jgi:5-methylcytosine-specific restriction endonuclease McrA